jgi:hypothetical protein
MKIVFRDNKSKIAALEIALKHAMTKEQPPAPPMPTTTPPALIPFGVINFGLAVKLGKECEFLEFILESGIVSVIGPEITTDKS